MMPIFVGLGDPKNLSTILLCRGDLLPERVQILAWVWNGVRGARWRNGGPMMQGQRR